MIFSQVALLFGIATLFAIISFKLKQPLIVGYVLAGLALSAFGYLTYDLKILELSEIGVSLLLFLVGIEMNLSDIRNIGKLSLVFGFFQILVTTALAFLISRLFGFSTLSSVYISFSITFSSTIVAVTLLSSRRELNSLHGKVSLGYLLVQDLVAILLLIFLGSFSKGMGNSLYLMVLIKAVGLGVLVWFLTKKAMPVIFSYISGSSELSFVFGISWALVFSALVAGPFGFNLEIGGFLAGLTLSSLPEHFHLASKIRPLRDFFLVLFFLLLGMRVDLHQGFGKVLPMFLVFTFFVLVAKPLIELFILKILGFKKKTSFLIGISSSQISEFSFILMSLGLSLGQVQKNAVTLIILVGIVSMVVSAYAFEYSSFLYKHLDRWLSFFEKKKTNEIYSFGGEELSNHVILIGCDRTGRNLLNYFKKYKIEFLVIDFNPEIIQKLSFEKLPFVFGDASDPEILDQARITKSRAIVSTISRLNENLLILSEFSHVEKKPISIFTASSKNDALRLYEMGASYVVVPESAASEHIRQILRTYLNSKNELRKRGKHHFERLLLNN